MVCLLQTEVASFKNTRHDNIVLFMGYSFDQHKLGIVMYYCKGRTLHQLLHDHLEKFNFTQIVHFATQICQVNSAKLLFHQLLRSPEYCSFMILFVWNPMNSVCMHFNMC